jgi:hypothetical protein
LEEREALEFLVKKGKTHAYRIKHANNMLAVDADGPERSDEEAAEAFGCHVNTVGNVRQRFVEQGLEAALERTKQKSPSRERILDGEKEARLIALACSAPPEGRSRWTLVIVNRSVAGCRSTRRKLTWLAAVAAGAVRVASSEVCVSAGPFSERLTRDGDVRPSHGQKDTSQPTPASTARAFSARG